MAQQNFIKIPAKLDGTNLRGFVPVATDKVIGVKAASGTVLTIYYAFRGNSPQCLVCNLTYSSGVTAQDAENLKDLIIEQSKDPGNVKIFRLVADVDHDATYAVRYTSVGLGTVSDI